MANNRNRDSDSGNTPTTSGDNAVFVDTSLDTHLAVIVSDSDTVSDLKKKIVSEHPLCFPNFGDIKINALKVKRRRCLYHLSDSMLVRSAFEGAKKCWFISVDAFSLNQHDGNRLPLDCAVSNQLPVVCCTKTPMGDLCKPSSRIGNPEFASSHTGEDVLNNVEMTSMGVGGEPWKTSFLENNVTSNLGEIQETHFEYCNDKSMNMNGVVDLNDSVMEEEDSKSRTVAKKKRKRESKGNENPLEGNDTLLSDVIEDPLKPKDKILESSMEYKLNQKSKKTNPNMASVAAIVSEINMQDADPSGTVEVPRKQKHCKSVQQVVEQEKLTAPSVGSLFREGPEVDHLVAGSSRGAKESRKKKKLPTDEAVNAEPSSLQDAVIEGCKENGGGIVSNDTHNASGSVIVSEQNDQCATLSVQEVVEGHKLPSSSMDSLLAKHTEDIHLVAASSSGMNKSKRKKKKLPTDEVVNAEPSFVHVAGKEGSKENVGTISKDSDKASDSVIVSELNAQHVALSGTVEVSQKQKRSKAVQEVMEGNELPSSEGINASRPDATNEKGETDAPDSGVRSSSKGKKMSKKHHSTDREGFPSLAVSVSDNLKKDDMQPQHANLPLDYENFETCGPQKIKERKELPHNHDPEVMLSAKCEPPIHGEADMHSKESVVSDNLLESTTVESGKSAGRRLKMSAKKSVAAKKVISSKEHDDNFVRGISSQVPRFNDHSGEANKEESFLFPTKKKKMSKLKTVDTSVVGANGQSDDMCGNEAESLPSIRVDKIQENPETINDNLRKNAEKNNSGAKTSADLPVKEQANEVEYLQLNQKVDMTRKEAENTGDKSGKTTKKSQNSAVKSLPESSTKEQEIGSEVLTPNGMLQVVETAFKTKKETKSAKTSSKSRSTGKELVLDTVPSSDTLEGSSTGRLLQHDGGGNASKNIKTTDANYEREVSKCDGDSINFKDYFIPGERDHEVTPVKLVVDNVIETKGSDKEMKTKKNSKKVVLPSPANSHDPGNSFNSYVNQGNGRRSKGVSKTTSKNMGEVVNSLRRGKSLFATPGAIFNGTSESSESESMTTDSDSGTKSPSDYSSSSGFSEGDGKLDLDSLRNGTPGAKDKDGGKSITKSQALGSENVTLDKILRSSSRFKKAKLTATQSQLEDTESQPVDFVPDSQANL